MKKKTVLSMAGFLLLSSLVSAQYKKPNRIFKDKQMDLQFSLGLAPTFLTDGGKQSVPPLSLSGEMMFNDFLSAGLSFAHSATFSKEEIVADGRLARWKNNYFEAGARFAAHVTRFDNMDIYGGFSVAYCHSLVKATQDGMEEMSRHMGIKPSSGKIVPGGILGFRYAISKKIVLMSEVGAGVSLFKLGVGYRVK